MVPFAGYSMPVQYPAGVLAEHLACRATAGLFDVSHMGQATVSGPGAADFLETLMPADLQTLPQGRQRYSFLMTAAGGIIDDLMVAHLAADTFAVVVNASRKHDDWALLGADLPAGITLDVHDDRALIALQGPQAAAILPEFADLDFMAVRAGRIAAIACLVSRSGYTGEDGFEISCPADQAVAVAEHLLGPNCQPIGLGARDSLRLEAGLCLYGNDIDLTTNPVEAALTWAIGKRRRLAGGYPGADVVQRALADGPARVRVGILPQGRAPARAGTRVVSEDGTPIGAVTSGGYGPTLEAPIAMGYVAPSFSAQDTRVQLQIRDKLLPARIAALPFVPHRYRR